MHKNLKKNQKLTKLMKKKKNSRIFYFQEFNKKMKILYPKGVPLDLPFHEDIVIIYFELTF